jgi:hypothetical protein
MMTTEHETHEPDPALEALWSAYKTLTARARADLEATERKTREAREESERRQKIDHEATRELGWTSGNLMVTGWNPIRRKFIVRRTPCQHEYEVPFATQRQERLKACRTCRTEVRR